MAEARLGARNVTPPVSRQAVRELELNLVSLASPEMLMGRWATKDVEVNIGKIGPALPGQSLTAAVKDSTEGDLFSFVHSFLPGRERAVRTAYLDDYVVLRLYDARYNGESFGLRLGYQRYTTTGANIRDVLLSLCAKIR